MRTWLLKNPGSGSADRLEKISSAIEHAGIEVLDIPEDPGALGRLLGEARRSCDSLIIAGGDGTVHRVINAMAGDFSHPALALLPLGTGNDLARTLGLPADPGEALEMAVSGEARPLDLLEVTGGEGTTFCANVCAGGFSGDVTESVGDRTKRAWGPLAYLRGAGEGVTELPSYEITLRHDQGPEERYRALNLVIANGRTAGGGITVAPAADPRDGLMEVITVKNTTGPELIPLVLKLLAGDYRESGLVVHRQARRLTVSCGHPILFSMDGEPYRLREAHFRVRPAELRFVAAPA